MDIFDTKEDEIEQPVEKKTTIEWSSMLKYQPREEQNEMVKFTMKSFFEERKKFVLLDAPVGIGKSYYAVMLADAIRKKLPKIKVDILTSTKILQKQYAEDFDMINNLWGAGNYECERHEVMCDIGKDICALQKSFCEECPQRMAKEAYTKGFVSLTNYHLYTTYAMYAPSNIEERGAKLLIVDEAHEFDSVLCDFVTVKTNRYILNKEYGFEEKVLKDYDDLFKKTKSIEQYVDMVKTVLLNDLKQKRKDVVDQEKSFKKKSDWVKKMKTLDNAIAKFDTFIKEYTDDPDNWIFEIDQNLYAKGEKRNTIDLMVQPIWSKDYLKTYVWENYDYVVLMSGTILDKKLFSFLNGLEEDKTAYLQIDSPFPKENRKIYNMPVATMNYDNKKQSFQKMLPWIKKIVNKYKDSKGIIHTVSFELVKWLKEEMEKDKSEEGKKFFDRFLFHDQSEINSGKSSVSLRDLMLRRHTSSKEATILVSPSMFTGIDLKDDLSRFQVILKIPYPFLGSQKIKKRKDMYPPFYGWRTVADIVQSYGRSVRNMNDYADTYILDASFENLRRYNGAFMPKYFKEAVIDIKI